MVRRYDAAGKKPDWTNLLAFNIMRFWVKTCFSNSEKPTRCQEALIAAHHTHEAIFILVHDGDKDTRLNARHDSTPAKQ